MSLSPIDLTQRRNSEKKLNFECFSLWSAQMAYCLGLVWADGSLSIPSKGSKRVVFYSTDWELVKHWIDFTGSPHPPFEKHPTGVPECWINGNPVIRRKVCYQHTVVSDTIGNDLVRLGIVPNKSQSCPIPQIPEEFLQDFIRGYFDGDGSITITSNRKMPGGKILQANLTSGPENFREWLDSTLRGKGLSTHQSGIAVKLSGSSAEKFCKWIYTGFGLSRKREVWENWQTFRMRVAGGLISEIDSYEAIRGVRPKPWHGLLGTMTDRDLAEQVGLTKGAVWAARKRLGILSFAATKRDNFSTSS